MRKTIYLAAFSVVSLGALAKLTNPVWLAFRARPPFWFSYANDFGQPISPIVQRWVPSLLTVALFLFLAYLLFRRGFLFAKFKSFAPPQSFSLPLCVVVSFGLLAVAAALLLPYAMYYTGTVGVGAQWFLFIATVLQSLLPIGLLVTEALSMRGRPVVAGRGFSSHQR